jgi:hypothetical protein
MIIHEVAPRGRDFSEIDSKMSILDLEGGAGIIMSGENLPLLIVDENCREKVQAWIEDYRRFISVGFDSLEVDDEERLIE